MMLKSSSHTRVEPIFVGLLLVIASTFPLSAKAVVVSVSRIGGGFSPSSVTINAGDQIRWTNNSSGTTDPSSDPHPTHTDYPDLNGSPIPKNQSRTTVSLTSVGTWGYHDHLDETAVGTITIQAVSPPSDPPQPPSTGGSTTAYRPTVSIVSLEKRLSFESHEIEIKYEAADKNIAGSSFALSDTPVSIYYFAGESTKDIVSTFYYPQIPNPRPETLIVKNLPADGSYVWDIADLPSGDNYVIIVEVVDKSLEVGRAISDFLPIDSTPPEQIQNAFVRTGPNTVYLSWINPSDPDFYEVFIIRREDRFALSRNDNNQVFVYLGAESRYSDTVDFKKSPLYYSIFSRDPDFNYSSPITIKAEPTDELSSFKPPEARSEESTTTVTYALDASIEPQENAMRLSWKNPKDEKFFGAQVVRNANSFPTNAFDGKIVFRGRAEMFEDVNLVAGSKYFYGIYVFDWENNFFSNALVAGIPQKSSSLTLPPQSFEKNTADPILKDTIKEIKRKIELIEIQIKIIEIKEKIFQLSDQIRLISRGG